MEIDDPNRDPLEVLADIYTQRVRSGSGQSLQSFAQEHAEYQQDILDLFPTILNLEQYKDPVPGFTRSQHTNLEGRVIGDFEIESQIARGGMGEVYRARQKSLNRIVALKILPTAFCSDPRKVARFQKEAMAAAKLHHTNIVPVFGVGSDEGFHFYAMQLIEGAGLDSVVRQLKGASSGQFLQETTKQDLTVNKDLSEEEVTAGSPASNTASSPESALSHSALERLLGKEFLKNLSGTGNANGEGAQDKRVRRVRFSKSYWKKVASIGRLLANALHYAHQSGITHRDIKPANILLGEDDNVWLTDFGLAKESTVDDFTQTGEVLGTFRYMAPEQFDGNHDARSDLHSLGLTLYELCALRPAFSGSSHADLIRQKTHTPPPKLRRLVEGIPADLETIISKCCSVVPQDRYKDAFQLEEDLQRFLHDEPIHGKRVSLTDRLGRWVVKNPGIAASTFVTFLLLLVTTGVSVWAFLSTSDALDRQRLATSQLEAASANAKKNQQIAEKKKVEAEQATGRANKNLKLAMEALDQIFQKLASRGLPESMSEELDASVSVPLTEADSKLLQELLGFYQRFLENNKNSPELQRKSATALLRMSQIYGRLGQNEAATESCRSGLEKIRPLLKDKGSGDPDTIAVYYQLLNQKGILSLEGSIHDIHSHWDLILDAKGRWMGQEVRDDILKELAQAYFLLGSNRARSLQMSGTLVYQPESGQRGEGGGKRGGAGRVKDLIFGRKPGNGFDNPNRRGQKWEGRKGERGQKENGRRFFRGREMSQKFQAPSSLSGFQYPYKIGPIYDLDVSIWLFSQLQNRQDSSPEVAALCAKAIQFKFLMQNRSGDRPDSERSFQDALSFIDQQRSKFPTDPELKFRQADLLGLSVLRLDQDSSDKKIDLVKTQLERARQLAVELITDFPLISEYRVLLATIYRNQGRVEMIGKDYDKAIRLLNQSMKEISSLDSGTGKQIVASTKAICLVDLANSYLAKKKPTGDAVDSAAANALNRLGEASKVLNGVRMRPEFRDPLLFGIRSAQSEAYRRLGQHSKAQEARKEANRYRHDPRLHPRRPWFLHWGPPRKRKD